MYLGIDIGTSGVKVVAIGDEGELLASASSALTVSTPAPNWSEQDPEDWWNATSHAVLQIPAHVRAKVRAIGLSGQMHGATLLDAADRPLRPAILWNDGRSARQCADLEREVPDSRSITGNIAMPGFTAPKLRWVRENELEIFAEVRTVLLPKDYVRLRMSGDKASDMADSAGTLWLDVGAREWSDTMLDACGLTRAHMPELFEGNQQTGRLRPEIAAQWGMDRVSIAAGAGDNAAGAIGVGVVEDGDALLSLGTSGVIFVATDTFRPNPDDAVHSFCHAVPGMWHQMSVHLSAASCVDWAARQLTVTGAAEVLSLAERSGVASGSEIFLPFLSGERTPHNDPNLRAGFIDCDHRTTPERLAAAVLEGVAFAHADGLSVLRAAESRVERLSMIGGGSRSRYWGRIIASVLNVELDFPEGGEVGPAMGAARLAMLAETGADPVSICTAPPVTETMAPDPQIAEALAPKLARYRQIIAMLKAK